MGLEDFEGYEIPPAKKPGPPKRYPWVLPVAFTADMKAVIQEIADREGLAFAEVVRNLVRIGVGVREARSATRDEFEAVS